MHNFEGGSIIHRDFYIPLNILLSETYQVKVCDLGISKCDEIFSASLQKLGTNNFKGTLPYMSHEIISEESATVYSDVCSLECTIIEFYQEKVLWKIKSLTDISLKFSKKIKPDLTETPIPHFS